MALYLKCYPDWKRASYEIQTEQDAFSAAKSAQHAPSQEHKSYKENRYRETLDLYLERPGDRVEGAAMNRRVSLDTDV